MPFRRMIGHIAAGAADERIVLLAHNGLADAEFHRATLRVYVDLPRRPAAGGAALRRCHAIGRASA